MDLNLYRLNGGSYSDYDTANKRVSDLLVGTKKEPRNLGKALREYGQPETYEIASFRNSAGEMRYRILVKRTQV